MSFPPMTSPRFRESSGELQYKPFPSYPTWLVAWNVGALVPSDVQDQIDAAQSTANTALTNAATALTAANEADDTADAAQSTANTALTNAATALTAANEADDTADAAQSTANTALTNAASALADIKARLPMNFALFSDEFIWTTGTKVYAVSALIPYNYLAYSTTNGAVAEHAFIARAGTYTINVLCQKGTTSGIIDMALDATNIVTNLDLYAASNNNLFIHTITGVVINNNGDHNLVFSVDGHNASSGGYYTGINKIWGYRTGA